MALDLNNFARAMLVVSAVFLSACASPGTLRNGNPDLTEATDKAPDRVAGCIGDRLEDLRIGTTVKFSTRPTANGFSISGDQSGFMLTGGTDTIVLIDISKNETRTNVRLYTHVLMGGPNYSSLIRSCL